VNIKFPQTFAFSALSRNSMKWPIGAGFITSAFPVRLTARGFSLLAADGRGA
jgi:hypothetical protein